MNNKNVKFDSIDEILELSEEYKNIWNDLNDRKCEIVLVGAGSTSEFIYNRFAEKGINPVFWADNSASKWDSVICGKRIGGVESTVARFPHAYYYITTQLYYHQLRKQLLEAGVNENQIIDYDLICQFQWEEDYKNYIEEHSVELQEFVDELADDFSKQVILNRLAFLVTRRREFATSIRSKEQYLEDFIDYNKLNLFVDVGTFTGDTLLSLEKYCGGKINCEVIAFEMDDELYEQAKNNLSHLGNKLKLIKKACSCEDGRVEVQGQLGKMQSISVDTYDDKVPLEKSFETCKIDTVLKERIGDKDNTLIKMDIEGAEMMALKGAKEFICANTPILAICIYHKADDILTISNYIKSCNSDYKFRARHYSDNQTETVLFAMVE